MRWVVVVLAVTGCAANYSDVQQMPPLTPAQQAAARGLPPSAAGQFERGYRDEQAATICRERANMAAAQPAYGGPGLAGSITAGLQQGWAGSEVEAACLRAYSATGVMPSY